MTEHQDDVLTSPSDNSVGDVAMSNGNDTSTVAPMVSHSPMTSPPASSSPLPLSQGEVASDDSYTEVITVNDVGASLSNVSLITPQEAGMCRYPERL